MTVYVGEVARVDALGNVDVVTLEVDDPNDGDDLQCTTVYVGSPGEVLLVDGQEVKIAELARDWSRMHRIDALFESAARAAGHNAVGVILSGMLWDGVQGLQAIREAGGVCIVQDPADATYEDMPRNANGKVALRQLETIAAESYHYSFMELFRRYTKDGRLHKDSLYSSLNLSSIDNIEISQALMKKYNSHINSNEITETTTLGELENLLQPLTKQATNKENGIPLSLSQLEQRDFMLQDPSEPRLSYIYHYRLRGKINLKRLEKAIIDTANAHIMLQCHLSQSDHNWVFEGSVARTDIRIRFPYFNPALKVEALNTYYTSPHLIRFYVYKKLNRNYLLVANSHLVNDARSQFLIIEEIFSRYANPNYQAQLTIDEEKSLINQYVAHEKSGVADSQLAGPPKGFFFKPEMIISSYDFNKGNTLSNHHFTLSKECIARFIEKHQLNDYSNSTVIFLIYFMALHRYSAFDAACIVFTLCTRNYPIKGLDQLFYPCFNFTKLIVPYIENVAKLADLVQHDTQLLSRYALNNQLREYERSEAGRAAMASNELGVFTYMDHYKQESLLINDHINWEKSSLYLHTCKANNRFSCLAFNLSDAFLFQFISTLKQPMLDTVCKNIFELVGEKPEISRTERIID